MERLTGGQVERRGPQWGGIEQREAGPQATRLSVREKWMRGEEKKSLTKYTIRGLSSLSSQHISYTDTQIAEKESLNILPQLIKYHTWSLILRGPRAPDILRISQGKETQYLPWQLVTQLPSVLPPHAHFSLTSSVGAWRISKSPQTLVPPVSPRSNCPSQIFS